MADKKDDVPEGGRFEPETYAKARAQAASPSTFGQAFKQARAAGAKNFPWQGKKYTTELASAKNPGGALAAEGSSVRTPKEYTGTRTVKSIEKEPGLEESGPLEAMLGPVKIAGAGLAAGLAGLKGMQALKAARVAKAGQAAKAERSAVEAMESEGGRTVAKRAAATPRTPARNLDEDRMAGEGGPNFKRGGKIAKSAKAYAKGGSVSGASKRGDGIASKGKTKGRMC